jgi:hypothetical protein
VTSKILFIGGPRSGKSNYLFRCWIAIERELGRLVKNGLPADLDYLSAGAADLLEGRFAPHTSRDVAVTCRIPVAVHDQSGSTGEIVIPDMSGELWLDLYEKREWPVTLDEMLADSTGFVLFVQANSPYEVPSVDWVTCERYYKDQKQPQPQAEAPTQVLLVEWLQIVRYELDRLVGASYTPRLSVVVSAWDRLRGEESRSPETYLSMRLPLFSDYLVSRAHRFDASVFGVTVASGDLDKDSVFRDLLVAGAPAGKGFSC